MILETIKNYDLIRKNIDCIIKKSGYKVSFLYREMEMDNNSFYMKRKNGKFTTNELLKLLEIIDIKRMEKKVIQEINLKKITQDKEDDVTSIA